MTWTAEQLRQIIEERRYPPLMLPREQWLSLCRLALERLAPGFNVAAVQSGADNVRDDLADSYRAGAADYLEEVQRLRARVAELTEPELSAGVELQRIEIDRLKQHLRDEGDRIAELRDQVAELEARQVVPEGWQLVPVDPETRRVQARLDAAVARHRKRRGEGHEAAHDDLAPLRAALRALDETPLTGGFGPPSKEREAAVTAVVLAARKVLASYAPTAVQPAPEAAAAVIAEMRTAAWCEPADVQAWADRLERAQWPAQDSEPAGWLIDWPDEQELGHYFAEEPDPNARSRALYTAPQQAQDAAERQRCLSIIRAYQVPAGNSPAGELAASWTMEALREVCAEIEAGASLAGPDRDLEATTLAASKGAEK